MLCCERFDRPIQQKDGAGLIEKTTAFIENQEPYRSTADFILELQYL